MYVCMYSALIRWVIVAARLIEKIRKCSTKKLIKNSEKILRVL